MLKTGLLALKQSAEIFGLAEGEINDWLIICAALIFIVGAIIGGVFSVRGGSSSVSSGSRSKSSSGNSEKRSRRSRRGYLTEYERFGIKGEHIAREVIESVMREGELLLANVEIELEEREAELDFVVINKYGVFIIEVKNYAGRLVGEENDFEWHKYKTTDAGNVFEKTVKNPIRQVKRQIYILARYLESSGARTWVRGYVVLVGGGSPVSSEYILNDAEEIDRAIHTADRETLTEQKIERIAALLSGETQEE